MLTAELLDRALQALVDIESDIPCDAIAIADDFANSPDSSTERVTKEERV